MGARIESVATAQSRRWPLKTGGLGLAEQAAQACLERAGRSARDIDLLINTGVYHDRNLGEPALAALIQEDIGANVNLEQGSHGTFSFDLQNGGAGVVTAMYLLDGFLRSGIELGLVIASDADPGTPVEPEFPFTAAGAAALLRRGDDDERGFVAFDFATFPEFEQLMTARIRWEARALGRERNVLVIDEQPGYRDRVVDCAVEATHRFMDRQRLTRDAVDLVIPSQIPDNFPDDFRQRMGWPADHVARVTEELGGVHTAGPLAAYAAAERAGWIGSDRTLLFVSVGAGISVGLALYRT